MTTEPQDLRQRIVSLTNDELITLMTIEYADYRAEALDFAREELETRGFTLNRVGPEFDIVTPDGISLRHSSSTKEKGVIAASFAVGPAGISSLVYIAAAIGGVVLPLGVLSLLFLIYRLMSLSPSHSLLRFELAIGNLSMPPELLVLGLLLLVLIPVTYLLLGRHFGYKWPEQSWKWGLWIALPALVISFAGLDLFNASSPAVAVTGFAIAGMLLVIPACLGAVFGVRTRVRKEPIPR